MNKTTQQKGKGALEEVGGKIKRGVGRVIGNRRIEAEGAAKEAKGKTRQAGARAVERVKGKVQAVAGAVKGRAGRAAGSARMEAEGRAKQIEGEDRQARNRR
jgi:uncharacterized protein YjbJ (UPF0337 family)